MKRSLRNGLETISHLAFITLMISVIVLVVGFSVWMESLKFAAYWKYVNQ